MKKTWRLLWIVCIVWLTGCGAEYSCLVPISPDVLSQNVYDDLRHEWDAYQTIRFYAKKTSKIKIEFYRKKNVKRGILIYGDREESHTGFLQKAIWRNPKNFVC